MARIKHTFMRVDKDSHDAIKKRVESMNDELRMMGVKKKLHQIDLVRHLAKRLVYINDKDLIKMTYRRRSKLC